MKIVLPLGFKERMNQQLGEKEFLSFLAAYDADPLRTIRLNPKKECADFDDFQSIPWFKQGRIISEGGRFITDPLWHAGAYYVQEPSSMIIGAIFKQIYGAKSPRRALDLCAAPGGKSTLLQSVLSPSSVLVANEVIHSRGKILKENHVRMGLSENLILTQNDPRDFAKLKGFFDYLQVDAPCSGEGMFRKGEVALREWSERNCDLCAQRQKRILADVAPALAKEGYLVYSTCTFNPAENEEMMYWAANELGFSSLRLSFDADWGVKEVKYKGIFGYYFYPHKTIGEGLFISVLQKEKGAGWKAIKEKKLKPYHGKIKELSELPIVDKKGKLFLSNERLYCLEKALGDALNIIYSGVELGEIKGKSFIPAQPLANFHREVHIFPKIEVDRETALEFLRGNDPKIKEETKGIYLLTFKNSGLGWIKFLGNRSNNYYPKGWRIRKY